MVSFLHIADKNEEKSIVKNGIRAGKRKAARGVYAVPVVPSYAMTHQWARELKRSGVRTLICVQFRIPNDESVLVGEYNGEKLEMSAGEAAAAFLKHTDSMGLRPPKWKPGHTHKFFIYCSPFATRRQVFP